MAGQRSRITIRDVASRADMAVSTVSRALNGHPDVSEQTRERVMTAARDLGFELNPFARGLTSGRTGLVAMISYTISNEYSQLLLSGFAMAATNRSYRTLLTVTSVMGEVLAECNSLHRQGLVEGAVVHSPVAREEEGLQRLQEAGMPLVIINPTVHLPLLTSIQPKDFEGAFSATRHLIKLGHKRIGIITHGTDHAYGRERLDGYKAAMNDANLPIDDRLIALDTAGEQEAGRKSVGAWLDANIPFTGVVCYNDFVAYGVYQELTVRGINVPREVSIVGFDDLPTTRYIGPGLTTVRQPVEELGRQALNMLADLIAGTTQPGAHLRVDTQLVVRGSTMPPLDA